MKKNYFVHEDILSADQFSLDDVSLVMERARDMEKIVNTKGATDILKGKIMAALFYEPSSRTFSSFITSMQRLGGGFIPLQGMTNSSVAKGETLPDTIRTFASFADVIVIRHPEVGSAKIAAEFSSKPVINAGDGIGEHPSQSLLDAFTISRHFLKMQGLTVTFVGDMLNGRTVHSLTKVLSLFKNMRVNLVSPAILRMPQGPIDILRKRGLTIKEMESLDPVLGATDVLYVTRVQKERFTDLSSYEKLKHRYVITPQTLQKMKKTAIVMHPLPRVGEIAMEVDLDSRALYFSEQMRNGLYVRMAILSLLLGKK